jgi:hypothetical protein
MAVSRAIVDDRISEELTNPVVRQVLASLWAADCQGCGQPLADQVPALTIDAMTANHRASLFHPRCRASQWNNSGGTSVGCAGVLSWTAKAFAIPTSDGPAGMRMLPMMLLNPGLEAVTLVRGSRGAWSVDVRTEFGCWGLRPRGEKEFPIGQPVTGSVAQLGHHELAVTLDLPGAYTVGLDEQARTIRDLIVAADGVLLAVTHAVNPSQVTDLADLRAVLAGDRTLFGWVELASVGQARPQQPTPSARRTFVLHYSSKHLAVGPLLAHNREALSKARAKRWAEQIVVGTTSTLITWEPFRDQSGYFTVNSMSEAHFALRLYPDGWRLTKMLSRTDGAVAKTETEARAWAAGVLAFREKIRSPTWQPGPTPNEGITTLYTKV